MTTHIAPREPAEQPADARRKVEAELRATLDSTADGILAVDNAGNVLHTSRRFAELWRIPESLLERHDDQELLGFVLEQLVNPDAFIAKVQLLYASDAEDMDTLLFKDGRSFERYSVPMLFEGQRLGRVWSFRDITERQRADLEREVMHEIAQGVASTSDLDELLLLMHRSLQRVFDAENCFVALHDPETGLYSFPYFVDQFDTAPAPVAMPKSCTAYVFRAGTPTLITPSVFRQLQAAHDVELVGSPSPSWMGVPLPTPAGTIGVLVLQQYEKEDVYSERDLAFLAAVGEQVAVVIERKLAERSLRASERRLREAQRVARVGSWEINIASGVVHGSESLTRMMGRDPDLPFPAVAELGRYYAPESWDRFGAALQSAAKGIDFELDLEGIREDGSHWWQTARGVAVRAASGEIIGLQGTVLDITERRRAELATAAVEAKLHQASTLESVGRLAGGVAHEFNNMLAVILGFSELAMQRAGPTHPSYAELQEIQQAAQRSAVLTRQLLAYARKQTVQPVVLDLNAVVSNLLGSLQRLFGEHVQLEWHPAAMLWPVAIDPSQLDQILTSLCLNARDAITDAGTISVATANCPLDAAFCADHPGAVPGDHVRLTVHDTGRGMSAATLARIFEPFFTTKGVGEGTGLGLASVFGAVKQNGGFISATSELGQGATFEIYLPRQVVDGQAATSAAVSTGTVGRETILVVEDEPAILRFTIRMLESEGYTVLGASDLSEALRLTREHPDDIHLLLSDVVMPETSGREVARALMRLRPRLKQLFMSGHTADVIASNGMLDRGMPFIEKPFSIAALTAKVREVLDHE